MKRLFFILLFIPGLLHAQIDPRYDAGKVPVENGKVVFTKNIQVTEASQDDIFNRILQWANERFIAKDDLQSRVLFSDKAEGQIACLGQQYLVFTDKALALDRATVNYQLIITCQPGQCNLKISTIRYLYNVGDKQDIIPAEEQITDEYCFNKKKDKLIKATGKFRTHTIDMVNEIFDSASETLAAAAHSGTPVTTSAQPAVSVPTATEPVQSTATASNLEGYRQISPDKIPGNIYKMLSENWMLITAGNDNGFNMMTASFMESKDTYTLSFYTEAYRDALNYCGTHSGKDGNKVQGSGLTPITTPNGSKAFSEAWLIIECKKMVEQQFTPEAILDPAAREKWGAEPHKMFIGEIINVWVK